jgi:hypothetical protein
VSSSTLIEGGGVDGAGGEGSESIAFFVNSKKDLVNSILFKFKY